MEFYQKNTSFGLQTQLYKLNGCTYASKINIFKCVNKNS